MEKYIPTYTNISDWEINLYSNTGGSRAKRVAVKPQTEELYFFKGSKVTDDGGIKYPTEFWSEIVSSKIGQYFGFNMLDYNIAYRNDWNQKVGCFSKSMVEHSENKLTEGKAYLTNLNPNYNPETDKKDYTFQFITEALNKFYLKKHIPKLIEVIILDALIGNSDRHQENWGFINNFKEAIKALDKSIKNKESNFLMKILLRLNRFVLKNSPIQKENRNSLTFQSNLGFIVFSPIYDSGCCLGREIQDEKVITMLNSTQSIEKYLRKGVSEIHWEGNDKKQNHFELIKLLKTDYRKKIEEVISRVNKKYNSEAIATIINNIDKNLPKELSQHKLSDTRKQLMIKLISLRAQKLQELI